ncbi:MAG TPA: SDR family oxidoreductase [Candidatus Faecousia intestinigallinarum]|nr:SDR family oxidoreductase [Candidatus Faecousia intestinigallinarum]
MKVILITGVSSGFGRAMALALAAQGHRVYGVSRRIPEQALLDVLAGHFQLDLCKPNSAQEAVDGVLTRAGRLDVLINNAGAGIGGALEETDNEAMERLFQINYFAMTRLCRAALPAMRRQGSGMILNFSSLGGIAGLPYQGAYSASKFAVEGYTEALRSEVKPFGIHVCMVEPGDFATGFTGNRTMAASPDSPYQTFHASALRRIEQDEQGGSPPEVLAKKVLKIVSASKPRLRYTVGNPAECLLVKSRHILGDRLFLFLLGKYYGAN